MASPPQVEKHSDYEFTYKIPIENEQKAIDASNHFRSLIANSGLEEQGGTVEHVSGTDGQQGASYSMTMQKMVGSSSNRRLETFVYKYDIVERGHDRVKWTTTCNGKLRKTTTLTIGRSRDETGKILAEVKMDLERPSSSELYCQYCLLFMFLPLLLPMLLFYPCCLECARAERMKKAVTAQQFFDTFSPPQSAGNVDPSIPAEVVEPVQTSYIQPAEPLDIPAAQPAPVAVQTVEPVPSNTYSYGTYTGVDTGIPPAIVNDDLVKRF